VKKTFVALAAATVLGGGLVGVAAESAQAACPYTGCVATTSGASVQNDPVKQGKKATICVKVTTGGSGQPKGSIGISVTRADGGFRFTDSKHYDGRTCFTTPALSKKGQYVVRTNFEGRGAFKDSRDGTSFRVTKKG
jgi:hypothetical protein